MNKTLDRVLNKNLRKVMQVNRDQELRTRIYSGGLGLALKAETRLNLKIRIQIRRKQSLKS
jgi:hypothetical protein